MGPVPFGATCTVAEPATGATDEVIVDGPIFVPDALITIDEPIEDVTVSNTYIFAPGTLQLVKELDGPAAGDAWTLSASNGSATARSPCSRSRPRTADP